jgi:hypothetical protein
VKHTSQAHASKVGASIAVTFVLALSLSGCSGGSGDGGSTAGPTVGAMGTPSIQGGDDFCDMAVRALAAEGAVNKASEDLSAAMTSGDLDALHAASQAILDNAAEATTFYALGADVADDQATKAAFDGLGQFVADYSIPMGQAGVDAASVPDYTSSITTLFADPALQPLLGSAAGWAQTTSDFAKAHCAIT